MKPIEIAQRLAQLSETDSAVQAYKLALQEEPDPTTQMEAAAYILQFGKGEDYKISYTFFRELYNRGIFRENILEIMDEAFYLPNERLLRSRYDRNCKYLAKYPYIFRQDFPAFESLPLRFYPYDDNGYTPYDREAQHFGDFINFRDPAVKHYFFKDLDNPILATDVYSQYELEYLRDTVRKSEDVARENHIYLHYTSWPVFCSYLACLNLRPLLESGKFVFLFEGELGRYPIDFKEEFGIDYSGYTPQPVGVREINRLIWHTQLSTHNGGDFFNEIFDAHPNLLMMPSVMLENVVENVENIWESLKNSASVADALQNFKAWDNPRVVEELYRMRDRTDKDILVAMFLCEKGSAQYLDAGARIAPAVFFQPHFPNIVYNLNINSKQQAVLYSEQYEHVHSSPLFQKFKYIKTFTPMRRFTVSHGATVKFMYNSALDSREKGEEKKSVVSDAVSERVLNRSFMVDPEDRLYHDSVLVRFEDGKLNPKATFTALAAFLDLPYTESFTYCSSGGERDPESYAGNAIGFDPVAIYRTYDDYVNDSERYFIEYFLRDAYEYYGYGFQYYDGAQVDEDKAKELIEGFTTVNHYIRETWREVFGTAKVSQNGERIAADVEEAVQDKLLENYMEKIQENRLNNAKILLGGLRFINRNGQPLYMMPKLELDPALLEQPVYH